MMYAKDATIIVHIFSLYLPGRGSNARKAEKNLRTILDRYLHGIYELKVIDVFATPEVLERDQILAVPTLIKRVPGREYRVVGDFSDEQAVLRGIEVPVSV